MYIEPEKSFYTQQYISYYDEQFRNFPQKSPRRYFVENRRTQSLTQKYLAHPTTVLTSLSMQKLYTVKCIFFFRGLCIQGRKQKEKLPLFSNDMFLRFLQSLRQDFNLWSNGYHFRDVQSGDAESFCETKFAIRFGIWIVGWSQSHLGPIKHPHAFNAFHATSMEWHF